MHLRMAANSSVTYINRELQYKAALSCDVCVLPEQGVGAMQQVFHSWQDVSSVVHASEPAAQHSPEAHPSPVVQAVMPRLGGTQVVGGSESGTPVHVRLVVQSQGSHVGQQLAVGAGRHMQRFGRKLPNDFAVSSTLEPVQTVNGIKSTAGSTGQSPPPPPMPLTCTSSMRLTTLASASVSIASSTALPASMVPRSTLTMSTDGAGGAASVHIGHTNHTTTLF